MARGDGSVFYNRSKDRWCAQFGRGRVIYAKSEEEARGRLAELKAEYEAQAGTCVVCGDRLPLGHWALCGRRECKRVRDRDRALDAVRTSKWARHAIGKLEEQVSGGDLGSLGLLWGLIEETEQSAARAIDALLGLGFSLSEVGAELGKSKQAVRQWLLRHSPGDGPPSPSPQDPGDHGSAVNEALTSGEVAEVT